VGRGKRGRGERKRCRFYVNTNFFVDLEKGEPKAVAFARKHRGELCTSTLLVMEYRAVGKGYVAKRIAREFGIAIVKASRGIVSRALRVCREVLGIARPSPNTVIDVAHILMAKRLGATFVTADESSVSRARKLGVEALNYREEGV